MPTFLRWGSPYLNSRGRGAFRGLDQMQIMYRLVQDRMPTIEPVGPYRVLTKQLNDIFIQATKHDVNTRYAHATAMREALVALAVGAPSRRPPQK